MDILYYIGSGSSHNNDELRLSLRSIDTHCKDIDKVWIVGNKPAFLRNVEYLWVEDKDKWWKNAFTKTKAAIEAGISDEFLLMNDDFFMIADFNASDYPYFHKGEIPETGENPYRKVIVNTGKYLKSIGANSYHYGIHCPMRIEGKKYLELEKHLTQPMSVRCLYGNLFADGKLAKDVKGEKITKNQTKCYSAKERMSEDIYQELLTLFPNPSRWEEVDL